MVSPLLPSGPDEDLYHVENSMHHKGDGGIRRSREDGSDMQKESLALLVKRILITQQKRLGIFLKENICKIIHQVNS